MAELQDPEVPDVPDHNLFEEDMMFVSLLYNYILALEALLTFPTLGVKLC